MRRPTFGSPWSATMVLLVVNVVAFILQNVLTRFSSFHTDAWFALSVAGLRHGYVWQLLTYQFMHGGLIHLLLNCWAIFVFGREVEETLGRKRFLTLYFSSGVIGGLFQALSGLLLDGRFAAPVVGASASAFGLVAAFAMLYPERLLTLLILFIIPVSMRAKFLLLFSAALALYGIIFPTDNIAHAAHLGGMLTGIVFVRYALHWHWPWPRGQRTRNQPLRPMVKVPRRGSAFMVQSQSGPVEDLSTDEFLSKAVDPILDKISAHGIQSLTERERRILETAREKMGRR
ncbi:MAG: rhomboid family intramembrane serine protease [Verrucomicrobia bacterium]|nr:rhomboid family intramembrane serine protease [Verrucomicrobiota bacterium]